jgi:hypothetical protein
VIQVKSHEISLLVFFFALCTSLFLFSQQQNLRQSLGAAKLAAESRRFFVRSKAAGPLFVAAKKQKKGPLFVSTGE